MYKHSGSQVEYMIRRLSVVSNTNDLLIKKYSIQKRHLLVASENENVNFAEIVRFSYQRK